MHIAVGIGLLHGLMHGVIRVGVRRLVQDIIARHAGDVAILADQLGVSMTQVSLAWLLARVNAPVVGMTKSEHVTQAAAAVNLHLTAEQMAYLEELYVPHALVGVMAQNQTTGVV